MAFTVVSTFAGCGGSSLGYKQAGATVLAAVEWEDHAVQCYRANHPSTLVIQEDIGKLTGPDLLGRIGLERGELDLLDGSPPCQGFSHAGARLKDDPRNELVREHLRLVEETNPKHVVIENVAGLVAGGMKPVAASIYTGLVDLGYEVVAGIMDAAYFGAGAWRPRVFFVGSRVGRPALPRPTTRATSARAALANIDPGRIPRATNATERMCAQHLRPGENGAAMLKRLGRDRVGWFNRKKMHPARPSFCLTKFPRCLYHWEKRLVTIPEALVLAGFPADYQLPPPPGATERQSYDLPWMRIGNAVAPPMTREIARQVLMPLSEAG
jgi:DNA (cytosine-5)-methyltransferase 1